MSHLILKCSRLICASAVSVLLISCGGGGNGDDGGMSGGGTIIGTGVHLEGTVSSVRKFASNDIEIKSKTGQKTTATISNSGRFQTDELNGEGPFLLRADMGNSEYLYSIAHVTADSAGTHNIHSYTDAAARNWFVSNGFDIDAAFTTDNAIETLPTAQTQAIIASRLAAIVSSVLDEYGLLGTDLETVSYDADNTGVDLYLDKNPVLINNGSITIIITDPNSRLVTQSSVDVPLSTDLTQDDVVPPSAPTSIRALPASMSEIVVVWDSAIDNIGVTAYQVFRDNELIATTPFPVYTDINLQASTQYSYSVVAIDSSGNTSVPSLPAISETRLQLDEDAPPTPESIMLEPRLNSLRISWLQSEIFDVAAFNVYRTGSVDAAQASYKLAATFFTDATVSSGSEYCYQVSAVDASGNESELSAVQCATTSGSPIGNPTTPPSNTAFLAPTVDVSGLSCIEELSKEYSVSAVITAGCYLAPKGLNIAEPANLTINPGVVIKFGAGTELFVNSGASLTAVGNANAPIVFSSVDRTPGYWDGLRFFFSNSVKNQLDFVLVEYAGANDLGANVQTVSTETSPSRVSIKNTTTRLGLGYGFEFGPGTVLEEFTGNLMVQNNVPIIASIQVASNLKATSRYSGNAIDTVNLTNTKIERDSSLASLDVPYRAERIDVDAQFTIAPGVNILFADGGELFVSSDGVLKAVGTEVAPIVFTATEATPGYWNGIRLFFTNRANQIDHAIVEYAGAGSNSASLLLTSTVTSPSRLSANNLILRESSSDGFLVNKGSNLTAFNNITSTLNDRPGSIAASATHLIGPGASFTGNATDRIAVINGDINQQVTWLTHDVPYVLDRLNVEDKLTLSPGATLLMEADGEIFINSTGIFSAIGTALNPILITGEEAVPGYWNGLRFFFSPSTFNRLEYVTVEYGGSGAGNEVGNIELDCTTTSPSRLSLENVTLNFSGVWGLYADSVGCDVTLGQNVNYTGNGAGGFNLLP